MTLVPEVFLNYLSVVACVLVVSLFATSHNNRQIHFNWDQGILNADHIKRDKG